MAEQTAIEFPELSPDALAHIKGEMEHNNDGHITAREFNIFPTQRRRRRALE